MAAGHRDADHIIGAHNRSAMLWLSERATRYAIGVTMPKRYASESVLAGLVKVCEQIPHHLLRSITFDHGGERSQWKTLAEHYKIDVVVLWRWWFPRGTDLSQATPAEVDHAARIINGQQRRNPDGQSPTTLHNALTVH